MVQKHVSRLKARFGRSQNRPRLIIRSRDRKKTPKHRKTIEKASARLETVICPEKTPAGCFFGTKSRFQVDVFCTGILIFKPAYKFKHSPVPTVSLGLASGQCAKYLDFKPWFCPKKTRQNHGLKSHWRFSTVSRCFSFFLRSLGRFRSWFEVWIDFGFSKYGSTT